MGDSAAAGSGGDGPDPAGVDGTGAPVGRRAVLGLLGLGAAGIVGGSVVQERLASWLAPLESRDPTGIVALFPLGNAFRYYSVVGSVRREDAASYRLRIGGLVDRPTQLSLADLRAMPQTTFTSTFQCVTGWKVPEVRWSGVRLSTLLDLVGTQAPAGAVRFRSFDGTYTESLPIGVARGREAIVALRMLDGPVTHEHGGPVRTYISGQYGYKSTKWLSAIELTAKEIPGYWEERGYALDGTIRT